MCMCGCISVQTGSYIPNQSEGFILVRGKELQEREAEIFSVFCLFFLMRETIPGNLYN